MFIVSALAQAQSIRVTPVTTDPMDRATGLRFYCAEGYNSTSCREDVLKLRTELARHPVAVMGQWSFVLVSSDQWKDLVLRLGGAPVSPAFSVLGNRTTVLEQALFSPSANRAKELLAEYGTLKDLLRVAITHELGHALCKERDERRADDYGRELRAGRVPICKGGTKTRSD
jgi:hypothetical protein